MMNDELVKEAREDIKEIKGTLASIDKNLSLSIQAMENLQQRMAIVESKVEKHEKHIGFEKSALKLIGLVAAIIVFAAQIIPFIEWIKSLVK